MDTRELAIDASPAHIDGRLAQVDTHVGFDSRKIRAKAGAAPTTNNESSSGTGRSKTRSQLMTMRFPEKPKLRGGLSPEFLEWFERRTKPLQPPPDIPGERISNEIADLRAKLRRADRFSPDELKAMREEIVALNAEREAEELKPTGAGTYKSEKDTFRAHVGADGSVKLEDKPEAMDAQDRAMLAAGIDPYARKKLQYLDRTRDQRVAVGKRYRAEQLKRSAVFARDNVERAWASTTNITERKRLLFELWDECIEGGEKEEIEGGASARAFVMAFIRAQLTGPNAYTPDELAALNARRRSKELFAP